MSTELGKRLNDEREHGARIAEHSSEIWGWATPTGKRRLDRRAGMLRAETAGKNRVLELGAGTGMFTRRLAASDGMYVAVDISPDLYRKGVQDGNFVGAHLVEADVHRLPFRSGTFDLICGSSVLHHLKIDDVLREGERVLRTSGELAFSEPNMANPQNAIVKRSRRLKKLVGDTPHETAFYRSEMIRRLRGAGFEVLTVTYYDFLYPLIPSVAVGIAEKIGRLIEKIPVIRAAAGSLWIRARKRSA